MPLRRTYRVKDVAELSGVSIRALHHYDAIGLLTPSRRSAAGYRLYDDEDLLRLQQILIGRELGLALEDIRRSLDDPRFDRRELLLKQRAELERRAASTADMIRAIDAALAVIDQAREETHVDLKRIFDGFDPDGYADDVKRRWGGSDAYDASMRNTKSYTDADWARIRDEQAAIYADALAATRAGKSPDDPVAMDVAERHRQSIGRWFYPCDLQMHCALADMWEADRRFSDNIDKLGAGLTTFLAAAVRANARRARKT